jgi:hypothetical protein
VAVVVVFAMGEKVRITVESSHNNKARIEVFAGNIVTQHIVEKVTVSDINEEEMKVKMWNDGKCNNQIICRKNYDDITLIAAVRRAKKFGENYEVQV